jgi:hypothetical protein
MSGPADGIKRDTPLSFKERVEISDIKYPLTSEKHTVCPAPDFTGLFDRIRGLG